MTMLAMTAVPTEPPIVRMLAFMPLATPVCSGGTAPTIRPARHANARPMPTPVMPLATAISQAWSWTSAKHEHAAGAEREPKTTTVLGPMRRAIGRRDEARSGTIATADGSINRPDSVTLDPKP